VVNWLSSYSKDSRFDCCEKDSTAKSARREETERSLEHERAVIQKMTGILDKFELPNGEGLAIDLPDSIGLGTLFHEWESTKSEVGSLRNELQRTAAELQHKQLVLEDLSREFEIQSQSMSDTSFSDSDEETSTELAEMQAVSTLQGMKDIVDSEEGPMPFIESLLYSRKSFV